MTDHHDPRIQSAQTFAITKHEAAIILRHWIKELIAIEQVHDDCGILGQLELELKAHTQWRIERLIDAGLVPKEQVDAIEQVVRVRQHSDFSNLRYNISSLRCPGSTPDPVGEITLATKGNVYESDQSRTHAADDGREQL
jgi:hypothetical protein